MLSGLRVVVGALALLVVAAVPVAADHGYWPAGDVDPATVTGHRPASDGVSEPAYWGSDCFTVDTLDVYGYVLEVGHALAVVIADVEGGAAITLFHQPRAGEFLWADTDGDSRFAGEHESDAIDLIACNGAHNGGLPDTATQPAAARDDSTLTGLAAVTALLAAAIGAWIGSRRLGRTPSA